MVASLVRRIVDARGKPISVQWRSATSAGPRGGCVVTRATIKSTSPLKSTSPGRRLWVWRSEKGNSTETMSPTLNAVIDMIVWRVVLKETIKSQSLPVQILNIATDQLRHVLVEPKPIA